MPSIQAEGGEAPGMVSADEQTPARTAPLARRWRLLAAAFAAGIVVLAAVVVLVVVIRQHRPPPAAEQRPAGLPSSVSTSLANLMGLSPVPVRAAPGFTLTDQHGRRVSLAGFHGKTVLLEFFATWCPHCNAEAPHLQALYQQLPKKRYAFLGVNGDGETAPSVYAYDRYYGLRFPSLLDPSQQPGSFSQPGASGRVSNAYGLQAFPTFYVLDRRGRIVWRSDGEQPDALLKTMLAKANAAS